MAVLCTDLQILGCELHKNVFGGQAPPGPAGRAIVPPSPPTVIRGKRRMERGRGIGRGRAGKGEGGSGRGDRVWKGEGGLDLDICPAAPDFLVTPLFSRSSLL